MTTGLYVHTLGNQINAVQVEDATGISWSMDAQDYIARGHQPPIEKLPPLETYTRDRYLDAISQAFGGVRVVSPSGTWQVIVESDPAREILLSPAFVARNIDGGRMRPEELTRHLQDIGPRSWATRTDGTLTIVLN